MLPNCPINESDILHAEEILGPNLGSLKGKTTRKTPSRVHIHALDDLPDKILKQHKNVTLAVDIMYINKVIPCIIMTSRNIHFSTAEMIKNEKIHHGDITKTNNQHIQCKRLCNKTYADGQFERLRKNLK